MDLLAVGVEHLDLEGEVVGRVDEILLCRVVLLGRNQVLADNQEQFLVTFLEKPDEIAGEKELEYVFFW